MIKIELFCYLVYKYKTLAQIKREWKCPEYLAHDSPQFWGQTGSISYYGNCYMLGITNDEFMSAEVSIPMIG